MNTITILGTIAACCTTGSFVPQAIQVIKTKDTKGISLPMYILLLVGVVLWLVYGVMLKELPIIIANIITLVLSSIILFMKIKYK